MKKGDKVLDTWFDYWGIGVCKKALKTRFHIYFSGLGKVIIYDKQHLQFLRKA